MHRVITTTIIICFLYGLSLLLIDFRQNMIKDRDVTARVYRCIDIVVNYPVTRDVSWSYYYHYFCITMLTRSEIEANSQC